MLDFFSNYPLRHYLKAVTRRPNPPKIGMYISRDSTMMLIRKKNDRIFWSGGVRELGGAPGLEVTQETEEDFNLPTIYRKEIYTKFGLNKGNPLHLILDDPETYTCSYTVGDFENAEDLHSALVQEPSSIITSWKNWTQNDDYCWEILSPEMKMLRGRTRLPKKVTLCGFPAARALAAAKWAESNDQELTNLIPVMAAVLMWACKEGPQSGFFQLVATQNEVGTAYFENGEMRILTGHRTREGFTADEISDLNELAEEVGKGRDATIWCWGLPLGSVQHGRLASRYKNLRTITAENLRGVYPINLTDQTEKIQNPEAWLLDNLLGDEA